jgi:hypothetical protein
MSYANAIQAETSSSHKGGTDMPTNREAPETLADELPIIDAYADAEACDDGILVPITKRDRCTRALFEDLARDLPETPPNRWPVSLFEYIAGNAKNVPALRAVAACKGVLDQQRPLLAAHEGASPVPMWMILGSDRVILGLSDTRPEADNAGCEIWVAPNEMGGLTVMYPSDW